MHFNNSQSECKMHTSMDITVHGTKLRMTSSGTKVRTIVTKVKVKLRNLNFDPYPSRTRAGP